MIDKAHCTTCIQKSVRMWLIMPSVVKLLRLILYWMHWAQCTAHVAQHCIALSAVQTCVQCIAVVMITIMLECNLSFTLQCQSHIYIHCVSHGWLTVNLWRLYIVVPVCCIVESIPCHNALLLMSGAILWLNVRMFVYIFEMLNKARKTSYTEISVQISSKINQMFLVSRVTASRNLTKIRP